MSRNNISPYVLKPPRVFVTRDFPEGCNVLASRVEGNENKTGSSKGKEVYSPTNSTTRAGGKTVISPANPWSKYSVNIGSSSDENNENEALKGREVNSPINSPTRSEGENVISPANPWSGDSVDIGSSSDEGNANETLKGKEVNSPTRAKGKTVISPYHSWSRDSVDIGSSSDENNANESLKGKEVNSPTRAKGKTVISPANPRSRYSVNIRSSSAAPRDGDFAKETLKRFREIYRELSDEHERNRKPGDKKGTTRFDLKAAGLLKRSRNWVHPEKRFGHIPGIEIGDEFHYRAELAVVGLHGPYVSGIDYTVARDGTRYATSVVNSGIYENEARTNDVLIYSGQGGQGRGEARSDQKMTGCNRALANSMRVKYPVRVIRKRVRADGPPVFTYDGLYVVRKYWQERDQLDLVGRVVFKFELHRVLDQET